MAWSFTDLPYGWKIVTGITLAAATIFTADNIRQRINQRDEIELDLAAAERCYALQYGTNALGEPLFYVSPPEYVRSWYSNSYATQVVAGVTSIVAVLHTNIYTNAVGYRIDHAKAVARDATIKALCPFYVDTNSVYDGTTNIVMCTFTGLLTSLHLGDGTNFTSIPCWTNNEGQTNCTTNAATYGAWPWRIFKNNLEERYKVLNALKYTLATVSVSNEYRYGEGTTNGGGLDFSYGYDSTTMVATAMDNWEKAKQLCDDMAKTNVLISTGVVPEDKSGGVIGLYSYSRWFYQTGATARKTIWTKLFMTCVNDSIAGELDYYIKTRDPSRYTSPGELAWAAPIKFDCNGTPNIIPLLYYKLASFPVGATNASSSSVSVCDDAKWCDDPEINAWGFTMLGFSVSGHFVIFRPAFNYCTNKFW